MEWVKGGPEGFACDQTHADPWLADPNAIGPAQLSAAPARSQIAFSGRRPASGIARSRPGGAMPPPARTELAAALHLLLAQPPTCELKSVALAHFVAPTVSRCQLRRPLEVALSVSLHRRSTEGAGRCCLEDRQGADETDARHGDTCTALEWHWISPFDFARAPRRPLQTGSRRRSVRTAARVRNGLPADPPTSPRERIPHCACVGNGEAEAELSPQWEPAAFCVWAGRAQRRSPAARRRSIICE